MSMRHVEAKYPEALRDNRQRAARNLYERLAARLEAAHHGEVKVYAVTAVLDQIDPDDFKAMTPKQRDRAVNVVWLAAAGRDSQVYSWEWGGQRGEHPHVHAALGPIAAEVASWSFEDFHSPPAYDLPGWLAYMAKPRDQRAHDAKDAFNAGRIKNARELLDAALVDLIADRERLFAEDGGRRLPVKLRRVNVPRSTTPPEPLPTYSGRRVTTDALDFDDQGRITVAWDAAGPRPSPALAQLPAQVAAALTSPAAPTPPPARPPVAPQGPTRPTGWDLPSAPPATRKKRPGGARDGP